MNGLDLTTWIEKASTVGMIQTVCVVAALSAGGLCFFVFVTSFGSEPDKLNRIFFAFSLAVFGLSLICGTATGIYHRTELSETQFNRYVADGYGLAELDCTLPDDYLEGMDDFTTCTAVPKDTDMTVKTKVTRNLDFIIRDSRAYLYDENGKLMEVNTLEAAGIVSLPSQLNVIPIKPMALWMGAAGLAWIVKLAYQRCPGTPRLVQGIWAAAAVVFVVLSFICGYGFLKENWRVFFPWKPVSMQWEVTNIDSVRPLLDENGEFQIGMDGTMEAKLPEHCPAGSDPIQVGKLPESDAWRKQFTLDPNALMEYGNRCHAYSFVLSFDGTTATLYSTDSQ